MSAISSIHRSESATVYHRNASTPQPQHFKRSFRGAAAVGNAARPTTPRKVREVQIWDLALLFKSLDKCKYCREQKSANAETVRPSHRRVPVLPPLPCRGPSAAPNCATMALAEAALPHSAISPLRTFCFWTMRRTSAWARRERRLIGTRG